MKTRRKFTPEFKSQVVLQLLSGEQNMGVPVATQKGFGAIMSRTSFAVVLGIA